ncbi:MAG: TrbC/VirB2 family protein [Candidatus Andersenbacteria bacterium]|nr:TrbC/VirB2 family protein [Candidatus Andersenbacteria bacterium]
MLPLFSVLSPLQQSDCKTLDLNCPSAPTGADLTNFLQSLVNKLLLPIGIVGAVLLAVIIYAGIRYIASRGSPEETQRAKMILVYAVIGLVILGLAGIVVNAVLNRAAPGPLNPLIELP